MSQPDLDRTLDQVWQAVGRGVADRRHGFHWPVLCTVSEGVAEGRVVVLRGSQRDQRTLWFHTDRRSSKVDQLDGLSWVFYDPRAQLQLRVHGATGLADEATTQREWSRLPVTSRRTYLVDPAPGTVLDSTYASGMPAWLGDGAPTVAQSESGRASFAVVVTTATRLESLRLARTGHERAAFVWGPTGWRGTWLVP